MMKLKKTSLATLALLTSLAGSALAQDGTKIYVVQLKDEPAASYQGNVAGYAATQASAGAGFSYGTPVVAAYTGYLANKRSAVLSAIGGAPVTATYDTVFNGFAARLTPAQAMALSTNANVAGVFEDQLIFTKTVTTSVFLGLTAPGGVWSQTVDGLAVKGENMVIGSLDSGIWPENPAFADRVDGTGAPTFTGGTLAYGPPPATFTGACVAGQGLNPAVHCNNKLIGAKSYSSNLLASGLKLHWSEFESARDSLAVHGGHGSHTASTVAGNSMTPAVVNGVLMGNASGVAPRARIAAYKVCWTFDKPSATDGTGSANACSIADSMAAIDAAVQDGVNAINFSISGASATVNDLVEQAFYRATLAGVFVAASAGNGGPTNTANHPSPWLMTIGASTHDRALSGDIVLGNSAKYTGASLNTAALPSKSLIRAEDAALGGGAASLCVSDPAAAAASGQVLLDPAKVAGKIVICTRGVNARVDKSLAVANAGGAGMIMVDNGGGLVSEVHSVPTVHVTAVDGAAVKAYAASAAANATSTMSAFYIGKQPAPIMAGFSSRGPSLQDANIMKPDITAPGVGIIASITPGGTQATRDAIAAGTPGATAWGFMDGTSMSAPHVSGLGLLLKQAHPSWSPSAIKSALMTTTYSTLDDGLTGMQNGQLPWAQGAGHVNINKAIDPGLVYDAGKADYVRYQCLVNRNGVSAADCTAHGTLDQTYNLNLPSITAGLVTGSVTITRKVTNVASTSATYTSNATLPGFAVVVSPASFTIAPGATQIFTVKLTPNAGLAQGVWQYGSLSWSDGTHVVRSPMQAKAGAALAAPGEITATSAAGSKMFTVTSGFAGRMGGKKAGLKNVTLSPASTLVPRPLSQDQYITACVNGGSANVKAYSMVVPAGTIVARWALRTADVGATTDDHDLLVLSPDGIGGWISGGAVSDEAISVASPQAGTYKVCVNAYAGGASMTHRLSSWIVTPTDTGGNFNVMLPSTVYAGSTATVGFTWSGLATGQRYLGGVQLLDPAGNVQATTLMRVETNGGLPLTVTAPTLASKLNDLSK